MQHDDVLPVWYNSWCTMESRCLMFIASFSCLIQTHTKIKISKQQRGCYMEATIIEKTLSHTNICFWYHRRKNHKVFHCEYWCCCVWL